MKISDYDERQYRLMLERLEAFLAGHVSMDKILADLEGLLSALEQPGEEWRRTFQEDVNELDIIWGVALDHGRTRLTEPEAKSAFESAERLKKLVLDKIGSNVDGQAARA